MCRWALEVVQEKANLGTVEFNVYHDTGFELDIFHRESRLNIELDGPSHGGRLVQDDLRDEILARHKIKVCAYHLSGSRLKVLRRMYFGCSKTREAIHWGGNSILG